MIWEKNKHPPWNKHPPSSPKFEISAAGANSRIYSNFLIHHKIDLQIIFNVFVVIYQLLQNLS